jgi:hypothetical protein
MFSPLPKTKRIKLTKTYWEKLRREMITNANHRCELCDRYCDDNMLAPHHCTPKGRSGSDVAENIVVVCDTCHRDLHDGRMKMYDTRSEQLAG